MALRFPLLPVAGLLFSISFVGSAGAEPISVTSGSATVAWDDPSSFGFAGPNGFALTSLFPRVPSSPQQICFAGCAPGTSVDFGAVFGGPERGSLGIALTAVINGTTYTATPPALSLTGSLFFDAPSIVLPSLANFTKGTPITAPFVFSGHVSGFISDETDPRFDVDLSGRGTVRLHVVSENGAYTRPEIVYAFTATEPVPEPASMLLLGTGLAILLGRGRHRLTT